jgi:hypothetical protein
MRRLGWLLALVIIAGLPSLAHAQNGPWNNWGWGWGYHPANSVGPWNNWGWGWEHHEGDRDHHDDRDRHDRDRDNDRR